MNRGAGGGNTEKLVGKTGTVLNKKLQNQPNERGEGGQNRNYELTLREKNSVEELMNRLREGLDFLAQEMGQQGSAGEEKNNRYSDL